MKLGDLMKLAFAVFALTMPLFSWAAADEDTKWQRASNRVWNRVLRTQYFGDQAILESGDLIELTAPYRAEDSAMVPLKITSKIPQSSDKYIQKIIVLIDINPKPYVGEFIFSEYSGRADLAMRVRVNAYSYIRAIAQLNTGKLYMHKVFVKASGGCSAPIPADMEAAMKRLGNMKLKVHGDVDGDKPLLAQLMISHPNITGMQMDQVSRLVKPAHFVNRVNIVFNDKPVLTAKTDIAISADPNFRFYFVPREAGILKAEVQDNKGMVFSSSYEFEP